MEEIDRAVQPIAPQLPDFDDVKARMDSNVCQHELLPWACAICLCEAYQALRPIALAADALLAQIDFTGATPYDEALASAMEKAQLALPELGQS